MALINCKECNKQVSDKAVSCPNCGCPISSTVFRPPLPIAPPPNPNTTSSIKKEPKHYSIFSVLGWLFCLFVVSIVYSCVSNKSDTREPESLSNNVNEQLEHSKEQTRIHVSANQLFNAYQANEVAADTQYKGQLLEVTGTVESIDSDISDDAVVNLSTSNEFLSASATGNETFNQAALSLRKGQKIKLWCVGDGEIISAPVLKECQIL